MNKPLNNFKKLLNKAIFAAILVCSILLIIVFRCHIATQFNHIISFYYVYQGDLQYKGEHLQEAINEYNHALKLYPEHVKANYNLGNIYVAYEDYNSAVSYYEKALKYNPDYLNARINLGIILAQEIIDLDRAINEYQKAIDSKIFTINIPFIFNNINSVRLAKATTYYNLGLAYKAKSLLNSTNDSVARHYLANAAESYKNSVKLDPDSYDSHYNLALAYQLLGKHSEALEEYCRAINIAPLNYEAHYNLAILLKQKMMFKESVDELEKVGLILDTNGDEFRSRYIFQVLNEVSQRAILQKENKYDHIAEKLDDNPPKNDDVTYLNGKVVITEQMDKAIIENMKTCNSCKLINTKK